MKPLFQIALALAVTATVPGAELPPSTNIVSSVVRAVDAPGKVIAPVQTLPANVDEVIRLAESGMDESIILAFIEAAHTPFDLSADEVIYLNDLGISSPVLAAMLHQDSVLQEQNLQTGITPGATPPQAVSPSNVPQSPAPVYVTNAPAQVTYFYDALAPYGTWIELEGMGWCWQPRAVVIDHDWNPYWNNGRWIYSDYGWYWYSDYTWGWAPFHYGRWHLHPHHGWVWFPDLVWGPAWVTWRYSDLYAGWAPLPPGAVWGGAGWYYNGVSVGWGFDFYLGVGCWGFIDIGHCDDHHPHHHGHHGHNGHHDDLYAHTTVHNNYGTGKDKAPLNHGVPVERVAAASGRSIHPAQVRETRAAPAAGVRAERIERTGSAPVVYRPQLQAPGRQPSVAAQRVAPQQKIVPQPAQPPAAGGAPRAARTSVGPTTATPHAAPSTQPTRPQVTPGAQPPRQPGTAPRATPRTTSPQTAPTAPANPSGRAESPRITEQRQSSGQSMQRSAPPTPGMQPAPHGGYRTAPSGPGMQRMSPAPAMPRSAPSAPSRGYSAPSGGHSRSGTR